jgi:hypothetical protein
MAKELLRVIVDKHGRTFEAGRSVFGKPGVSVSEIIKVGSYVTVKFAGRKCPDMPVHVDDLQAWEGRK